jgi:uncharacterized protein YciI
MYVLVLFREGARASEHDAYATAHRDFVTSLIRRNLVLLGGDFATQVGEFHAAYLIRCSSLEEARGVIAEDPFFSEDVLEPLLTEWKLVGVNPDAVDPGLVVTPRDV